MTHSSPIRNVVAIVVLTMIITSGAYAQLSPWASIPSGSPQTVQNEQALLVVNQGNKVNVFSALTKTWTSITTVFGSPTNTLLNEHLIVRDGPIFYGYSPRTGSFQAQLAFSPTAALVSSASAQTWHSILIDGNYLHVFFAFTGQWITYAFTGTPVVTGAMNGRFCFLVADGSNLYAVSSFYGTLVPVPVAGAVSAGSFGNVSMALSSGMVHGFSASRGTWASMAVAAAPTISNGNAQPALVAINDGVAISMFSGNTGTFTTLPAAPGASVNLERYQAVVVDGLTAYGYSALLGSFSTLPLTGSVSVIKQQMFALINDGTSLTAYSAAKGAFAAPIGTTGLTLTHKAQVAALTPTGSGVPSAVYSSYLNQWVGGPSGVVSGSLYLTHASAIVEQTGGGLHGWSQRGTTWNYLPAPPMDTIVLGSNPPNTAETIFARAGNTIHTFNARTESWRSATTAAAATLVRAHYSIIIAQDGANAYGFSIWDDQWTTLTLQAPYSTGGGQVASGWVTDGANVYGYGGIGQLGMITEFPHFYRATTLGCLFRLEVSGEPSSPLMIAFSFAPASIPLPPYGTLLIDPSTLLLLAQAVIPASGVFSLTMQIPTDPSFSGVTPYLQAAITGPSGLYLTNSVFPTIY